ncbi:CGNR zinc finger domain-containing protein [Pelagibacterium lentulum]|uniref:CGNR zinc finger domain-containing protein n=1 Tax=Pelagibacterium lentulum TaxID=2029865 RepID=UPI000F8E836D|nr:CGNR zinc finger domain-containing protein [Pelagibacterium lentulum]
MSDTVWTPEHFIGGHPAIDFTNTVFTRHMPDDDNDLLNSPRDVGNWFQFAGLATEGQADAISGILDPFFMKCVQELREASFSVFDALAADNPPAPDALGVLFDKAAKGFSTHRLRPRRTYAASEIAHFDDPKAIIAFLAAMSVEASIVLPRQRLRACPRCGWLFVDTSRGGRRRWCSMQTCGNREKASRHRVRVDFT